MTSVYSYKIYTSVSELPENWNETTGNNIFLSKEYLRILEDSAPENMQCHFIGLFNNHGLSGIALSQFLNLSDVSSFGERDNCFKTKIRTFVFKNFSSNVLFIGNNMLTGQNAYNFNENLPISQGLLLLNKVNTELKNKLEKKGTRVHLTVFKDFSASQIVHFRIPEFNSFFEFTTQPNMVFDIRETWHSFDDYIADLTKKYRDQYKRARKKGEGIVKRKMSLDEIVINNDRIHELYMDVAKNAPFNTFYLPEKHFEALKKSLKDHFLFYGYFVDEKLIGFNTLIKNGDAIDTYFLGYDENHQREKMLYLNMLYDMVGYSINKKYRHLIFARTALEIKSSVGAKPVQMFGIIKHSNSFLNFFISKIFKYLEPEMIWQERNPFK
ncbi:MAG: GNAT family N-acetyltransferase [Bacteroidota bacterium]